MINWQLAQGREIDSSPLDDRARPGRVVACLNVWNDLEALRQTLPIWIQYVDAVIAVDGSYDHLGKLLSTDGTRHYLETIPKVQLVSAAGLSQCEKRSVYLGLGKPGDYLVIIDADERVFEPQKLRALPLLDVGWVTIQSRIYSRPYGQPRVIRWRSGLQYRGRHHWMYEGENVLCTHQYGGRGYAHRPVDLVIQNQRHLGRSKERMDAKATNLSKQMTVEKALFAMPQSKASDASLGAREALQILQYTYRDDGLAPSRLHTAINRTTPHWSVFFKSRPGPFGIGGQYDANRMTIALASAMRAADIVHFHSLVSASRYAHTGRATVFHHHGTLFRRNAASYNAESRKRGALVLVSNLELLSHTNGPAYFLPNVMPVARYRAVRGALSAHPSTRLRIGHSPSHPEKKGTEIFLRVCGRIPEVEPVVMTGMPHRDVLRNKATCDAFFDSFWLGIQCSGLEAAAMGLPVIAGDATVAERYRKQFGSVPYTYANTEEELESAIRRMVSDAAWRAAEADRVARYVLDFHDEAAVSLRYLDLLDQAFGWRSSMRTTQKRAVVGKR